MLFFVGPLAGMGFASTQYRLAMALKARPGSEFRSDVTFRQWLERAAAQGHPAAAMALARMPLSAVDRFPWLTIAAEGGLAEAQFQLYRLLVGASRAASQTPTALHWLIAAAEGGWADARYEMGRLLSRGDETLKIEKDPAAARDWWEKAADHSHGRAMEELAWRYAIGADRFPRDPERSVALLKKIAEGYQEGRYGLPQNPQLAAGHLRRAERLVEAHRDGRYGVAADSAKERYWTDELAYFERLFELAGGTYLPLEGLRRQADAGDPAAQYQLGRQMLASGAPAESREGLRWIDRAAANGLAEAQYRLVTYYENRLHIMQKDPERGVALLEAAAGQNHLPAMGALALAYHKGRYGLEPDYRQARDRYAKLLRVYASGRFEGEIDDRFIDLQKRQLGYATRALEVEEEKARRFQQATPLERRIIAIRENCRKQYEQAVNALDRRDGSVEGQEKFRAEVQRLRQKYIDLREQEIKKLNSGLDDPR